jgi:uncharacterized protein DUF262
MASGGSRDMVIRTTPNNMTIADYSEQLKNRQITINHNYQRSDKVWPISAKSNLIDTILMGYPVPKIILSQTTDLDTRKTRKEVVDGQQRTAAITEFLDNRYALSRGEYAGQRFDNLDDTAKRTFLDYPLSADVFTSATEEEIREVFRRINSYQVPLNREETRHATHQGEFKWFIKDMGTRYATSFVKIGIMVERQISRMADLELLTELVHAIKYGIKTANPSALDAIYTTNDKNFPDKEQVEEQLAFGLGEIINLADIHNTKLVSRPNVYSLVAALVAVKFPQSPLRIDLEASDRGSAFTDRANILTNLTALADAIEDDSAEPPLNEFVSAARQGTNTEKNRKTRFKWFHQALTTDRL